jgi:hypothetical protein
MEEGNKSQQKLKTSSNLSTDATVSEDKKPASGERALDEQSSVAYSFPYSWEAMSVSSLLSQQQHQQQHQQFHPSFHSFHTSGYETQPHHYYAQGEPQLQYFQSHQGNIQSSFQDDPQSLDHSQQLYFQHPQQDLLEAQNSPLRSNYFSTPRNDSTIHVAAGKSPTENVSCLLPISSILLAYPIHIKPHRNICDL